MEKYTPDALRKFDILFTYAYMKRKYVPAWDCSWQVSADERIYRNQQGFSRGLARALEKLKSLSVCDSLHVYSPG